MSEQTKISNEKKLQLILEMIKEVEKALVLADNPKLTHALEKLKEIELIINLQ